MRRYFLHRLMTSHLVLGAKTCRALEWTSSLLCANLLFNSLTRVFALKFCVACLQYPNLFVLELSSDSSSISKGSLNSISTLFQFIPTQTSILVSLLVRPLVKEKTTVKSVDLARETSFCRPSNSFIQYGCNSSSALSVISAYSGRASPWLWL